MDARLRADPAAPVDLPHALQGLRVALVHDWLTGLRGGEKCLEVLCKAFPQATIHTLIYQKGSISPTIEAMQIRTSPLQKVPGITRHYRNFLGLMPMAARSWDVGDVDLVVSLSHCVAKSVRVPGGVPHVCYCFTPMRYAWEGRAAYLAGEKGRSVKSRAVGAVLDRLRDWDRKTARGVSHFVAISDTVRERIARCYHRESRVIEPPVDVDFYTPSSETRDAPYLCVSALVPYKRIDQAIRVCSETGRELLVIGKGPDRARLESLAGPTVRFLGWQSDEVIRDHYRRCRALLFPGEEDFGIVPAEALACGAPVVALDRGGVAETLAGRFGILYPEPTEASLRDALDRWESLGMPHDPEAARRRAEGFATPIYRNRLLGYLAEVVSERGEARGPHRPRTRGRVSAR